MDLTSVPLRAIPASSVSTISKFLRACRLTQIVLPFGFFFFFPDFASSASSDGIGDFVDRRQLEREGTKNDREGARQRIRLHHPNVWINRVITFFRS